MKIIFKNDLQDLIAFNKYAVNTLPSHKKQKRFMTYMFPTIIMLAFIFFFVIDRNINHIITGLFMIVIYEIGLFIIHKRSIPRMINKISKDQSYKNFICEHTIEITEDGIIEKTEFNERKDYWKSITSIITDNNRTYIFVGPTNAHVINKDEVIYGDLKEFLNELNNKLKLTRG